VVRGFALGDKAFERKLKAEENFVIIIVTVVSE
jgi:hypothetical protein